MPPLEFVDPMSDTNDCPAEPVANGPACQAGTSVPVSNFGISTDVVLVELVSDEA